MSNKEHKAKKPQVVFSDQIPYAEDGSLIHYPEPRKDIDWRDNNPFEAELTFQGFSHEHPVAKAMYKNAAGATFPMFLADFANLVRYGVRLDIISGTWAGTKRGEIYGIRRYEKE